MARPPLRGYNHNIRYQNRVYHVQTEDSGLDNPHVFSHLFFGGVVISTTRIEYADIVQEEGHEPRVQKRMQEQHKALMKRLRRGEFDDEIVALLGTLDGDAEDSAADDAATPPTTQPQDAAAAPAHVASEQATEEVLVAAAVEAAREARPLASNFPSAEAFLAEEDEDEGADLLAEGPSVDVIDPEEVARATTEMAQAEAIEPAAEVVGEAIDSSFEPPTEETPSEQPFEPITDEAPLDVTIPQAEHLEPDLDPASLETFAQMATMAHPSDPLPLEVQEGDVVGIDVSLETAESPALVTHGPPPIPLDVELEPPAPVGSASQLPPLPIEEVQASDQPDGSTSENTGRYQNSLRSTEEPFTDGSAEASPDLDFRLRLGGGASTNTGTFTARHESAPMIPAIRVDRTYEVERSDDDAMIIDRPDTDAGPDDMTTSYSHVRRREGEVASPAGATPGAQRPSGVFNKPLPQGAQEPSASQMLGLQGPPGPARSAPPPRAPALGEPRRPTAPRVHAVQGSTPQRYTAPSVKSRGRGRRATGSYEAVESPVLRRPKPRPDTRPGARSARPATSPAKRPAARPPAAPARRGTAAPVVARPAVVVGGDSRKRPGSGVSIAARGPKVPVAPPKRGSAAKPPSAPIRPLSQTPRARARNLPNLFGSDLISERSLDEVILHYLAEDGEKAE
ncbi:MAG: hypothetical protein CSA65_08725 [Proteobacteria bacterium]|nr:MAG: hypothetical protein CSB49_07115 [Pseudomonadota bacterium]PIE17497.1 MAG: hypothetical protein CSA65_08725 [Pseudomonadota bacterium]